MAMQMEVAEVGRPQVIGFDPYLEDEVMREFDVDGISTPDDDGVPERRRSEVSEAMLSQTHSGSYMSSSKSDGISQAFAQSLAALQTQQVSEQVAQMQATRPEIIRAAPVWTVLRGLARPLRGAVGDFYYLSQTTTRLHAFWSHSWHGSAKHKIATIFFLHKASAATILGTASAVIAGVLYGQNVLPGFGAEGRSCWWCVMTGSLTYLLVLLFWQPKQLIFLDRVCISQSDPGLQAEGLLSLGAILKSSDSMLVLWDPSWARRLWCVFELAAFIRSRPAGCKPHVVMRPTILGFAILAFGFSGVLGALCYYSLFHVFPGIPIYFIMLIALLPGAVVFFLIANLARAYCRSVTTMCHQIGEFRIATAESYCCATDHTSESGEPMICDREVIQQCIRIWFGSVEAFERRVQNEVCDLLSHQLAYHMISYWRLSEATPIIFWILLDQAAERLYSGLQEGDSGPGFGVYHLIRGIIYWLAVVPFLFRVLLRVTWMLQAQPACRLLDWFLSSLILFVGAVLFLAFIFLDLFVGFYAFVFTSIPLALFTWRCLPVPVPKRTVHPD
ncbi:Rai14 [Symbiodinium sp. CCMP2592]|nr:Rai14 [Symbiodinium sp. CCMP2592]